MPSFIDRLDRPPSLLSPTDPPLHHHAARAAGAHSARPRGEELPGARAQAARGPLAADARRGEEKRRAGDDGMGYACVYRAGRPIIR